jgi:hypothetical protein
MRTPAVAAGATRPDHENEEQEKKHEVERGKKGIRRCVHSTVIKQPNNRREKEKMQRKKTKNRKQITTDC